MNLTLPQPCTKFDSECGALKPPVKFVCGPFVSRFRLGEEHVENPLGHCSDSAGCPGPVGRIRIYLEKIVWYDLMIHVVQTQDEVYGL